MSKSWWERVKEDPERLAEARAGNRARKRGTTVEEIEELRNAQNGCCGVCGVEPAPHADGRDGLYVDRRPDNGAVRGLLCVSCKRAVMTMDLQVSDPERWERLIAHSDKRWKTIS